MPLDTVMTTIGHVAGGTGRLGCVQVERWLIFGSTHGIVLPSKAYCRMVVAPSELLPSLLIVLWPLLGVAFLTPLLHVFFLVKRGAFSSPKGPGDHKGVRAFQEENTVIF